MEKPPRGIRSKKRLGVVFIGNDRPRPRSAGDRRASTERSIGRPEFLFQDLRNLCVGLHGESGTLGRVSCDRRSCKIKVLTQRLFQDASPSVVFADPDQNVMLKIGDEDLLIEGEPSFLDHVALIDTSTGNSRCMGFQRRR